jgi:hypothetical protein
MPLSLREARIKARNTQNQSAPAASSTTSNVIQPARPLRHEAVGLSSIPSRPPTPFEKFKSLVDAGAPTAVVVVTMGKAFKAHEKLAATRPSALGEIRASKFALVETLASAFDKDHGLLRPASLSYWELKEARHVLSRLNLLFPGHPVSLEIARRCANAGAELLQMHALDEKMERDGALGQLRGQPIAYLNVALALCDLHMTEPSKIALDDLKKALWAASDYDVISMVPDQQVSQLHDSCKAMNLEATGRAMQEELRRRDAMRSRPLAARSPLMHVGMHQAHVL